MNAPLVESGSKKNSRYGVRIIKIRNYVTELTQVSGVAVAG